MIKNGISVRDQTQKLREILKRAGLRSTLPRLQLLKIFREKTGHFSAEDLHATLDQRGVLLPKASVYNAVNDFKSRGLIREVDIGSGKAVFEDAQEATHHHFICRVCGKILDVPCHAAKSPCVNHSINDVKVDETRIIFRGFCGECKPENIHNQNRRQPDGQS